MAKAKKTNNLNSTLQNIKLQKEVHLEMEQLKKEIDFYFESIRTKIKNNSN